MYSFVSTSDRKVSKNKHKLFVSLSTDGIGHL